MYQTLSELPENLRLKLDIWRQQIYVEAYNNAWQEIPEQDSSLKSQLAHKIAWAAANYSMLNALQNEEVN